jgi:hypothetical protein
MLALGRQTDSRNGFRPLLALLPPQSFIFAAGHHH